MLLLIIDPERKYRQKKIKTMQKTLPANYTKKPYLQIMQKKTYLQIMQKKPYLQIMQKKPYLQIMQKKPYLQIMQKTLPANHAIISSAPHLKLGLPLFDTNTRVTQHYSLQWDRGVYFLIKSFFPSSWFF